MTSLVYMDDAVLTGNDFKACVEFKAYQGPWTIKIFSRH